MSTNLNIFKCLVIILTICCSAGAQTVRADFGSRGNTTTKIPAGLFGINGPTLKTSNTAALLVNAGFNNVRKFVRLSSIFRTSSPDWSALDASMTQFQSYGVHPLVVLTRTPPFLAPSINPCEGTKSATWAAPTDYQAWGNLASEIVAHLDRKFPGVVRDYEIWNEPESSLCVDGNADAARLKAYLDIYASASSAIRAQSIADGSNVRIGGPTIARIGLASEWIGSLLSDPRTAPNVDFVSFHRYLTGLQDIQAGMTWSQLYAKTQATSNGLAASYTIVSELVRSGQQPHPSTTPIYLTEYNDNWAFAIDCCRNSTVYGPLWNAVAVADLLNSVFERATAVPSKIFYFGLGYPKFCMFGTWDTAMDCKNTILDPYPQYYSYQLLASGNYLGLSDGGRMAVSVSPKDTSVGLLATAFYTANKDSIVIVNPTNVNYSQISVLADNVGFVAPSGYTYGLRRSGGVVTQSIALQATTTGYTAQVDVPALSVVALSLIDSSGQASAANLDPKTGTPTVSGPVTSPFISRSMEGIHPRRRYCEALP